MRRVCHAEIVACGPLPLVLLFFGSVPHILCLFQHHSIRQGCAGRLWMKPITAGTLKCGKPPPSHLRYPPQLRYPPHLIYSPLRSQENQVPNVPPLW